MKHVYNIAGMTCNNCVVSVKDSLQKIAGVTDVKVDLARAEAQINMHESIAIQDFQAALVHKYTISEKNKFNAERIAAMPKERSKLQQLKPLLLIFLYLFSATFLLHYKDWNSGQAMLDFMGLFYIVFSFFKLLDLKGFPESFRMYDPLAKVIPVYGWVYPFIELTLGLMFLLRYQVMIALIATIIILGTTTIGVSKTLLDKKSIRCACLGTALQLPMTEATFIENFIMLVMAITNIYFSF